MNGLGREGSSRSVGSHAAPIERDPMSRCSHHGTRRSARVPISPFVAARVGLKCHASRGRRHSEKPSQHPDGTPVTAPTLPSQHSTMRRQQHDPRARSVCESTIPRPLPLHRPARKKTQTLRSIPPLVGRKSAACPPKTTRGQHARLAYLCSKPLCPTPLPCMPLHTPPPSPPSPAAHPLLTSHPPPAPRPDPQ